MLPKLKHSQLLVVFLCISVFAFADDRNIRFTHLTNDDGLPNNTVYTICQDYKGFIWIGTKSGLCKYNGSNISVYNYKADEKQGIPSNQVRSVFEDRKQRLWIATDKGVLLYNRDKDRFTRVGGDSLAFYSRTVYQNNDNTIYVGGGGRLYAYNENTETLNSVFVNGQEIKGTFMCITSDNQGRLWIGTMLGGVLCVDFEKATVNRYKNNKENKFSVVSDRIQSIYRDSADRIWIGTEDKGVCYYDEGQKKFIPIKGFPHVCVRAFNEDSEGNIWIGSENGLHIYYPETETLINRKRDYGDKYSLNDNAIYSIFKDKENNMLIGTYFGGINIFPNSFRQFSYYDSGATNKQLSGRVVRQIIGDKKNNLWIATEDGGFNYFDREKGTFEHFKPNDGQNSLSYYNVHSLLLDRHDNLWVGTYLGGLNKYNLKTKQFTHYTRAKYPALFVNNIFAMIEDRDGDIWVGTTNGLSILNPLTDKIIAFEPQVFRSQGIDKLMEDSEGNIWIATRAQGVFCYNKSMKDLRHFYYKTDGGGLSDNFVNYLFEDSKGNIWIGTHDGGLCKYDKKTDGFTIFTEKDRLPSNTIFSITEDDMGNLWVSTNNGLSCYNTQGNYFTNYSISEGLPNKQFNYNSVYKSPDGVLYFGTIDGMISFYPKDLQITENVAKVEFTDFKIFGKSVKAEDENSPLSKSIEGVQEIRLTSDQAKSFTFDFTVPTISHSSSIFFAIKFGADKEWSYIGSQDHATFVNLPPGEYTLMVKASFNNKWTGNEPVRFVKVIIEPPFWKSTPAYLIYTLLIIVLAVFLFLFMRNRQKEKNLILSERLEKEKMQEINTLKLNFFTNISHQLRIPLSLILAPLQSLLEKHAFDAELEPKMKLVTGNAIRMKNLVEELMLFTKVETKQEKIRVKKGNLLAFINDICVGFEVLAEKKEISYSINILSPEEDVWFAPVKVEKIIYNILSNAFKYTEEGAIDVSVGLEQIGSYNYMKFVVSDTGIGIEEDKIEKIFENYYQVNDFIKSRKTGFGIGLSLTRELVQLHKGTIDVKSELGKGSTFTVSINVSDSAFEPDEISPNNADDQFMEDYNFIPIDDLANKVEVAKVSGDEEKSDKQYSILVVEDNVELLNFYRELFSNTYAVLTAEDGEEGYEIATTKIPDIIISDVMMPKMNGYDLARKLKSKIDTCHIPLILLTAKTGEESEMEGYDCGADLFLQKPFHPTLIQKQVSNLILTKENQKKKYLKNQIQLDDIITNDRDKNLISEIENLVKRNIDNEKFSINDILKEIGIGRTLLHIKLKNIVGLSATEFINNIRLKESLKILLSGGNVSEAAYGTGFSSPNYYSRCFKKQFGISPNEYISQHRLPNVTNPD